MIEGEFNREPTLAEQNKVQVAAARSHTLSKSFGILRFVIEMAYDR
jgi:hypothetical protein